MIRVPYRRNCPKKVCIEKKRDYKGEQEKSGDRKGSKRQQKVIKDKLFDDAEEDAVVENDENSGRKRPKRQRKVIKDKLCDDAEEDAVVENDETGGRKRSKRQRKVIQDKLYDDVEENDVVKNDGTEEKINRKRKRGVGKKKGLSKTLNAPKGIQSHSTTRQLCIAVRRLSDKQKEALLYVDRIVCKSMNVERKMGPLKFWTMERLHERENFEKGDGGFGSGELRDMYDHLSIIDDEIECILKHKIAIEKALCDAHIAFLEDDCVKSRITRYTSIFKEVVEIEKHVTQDNWTHFFEENMDAIFEDRQIIKKDRCKNIKGKSSPTFELLSPPQSSQETNEEGYELGDKSLKTAGMVNDMEGQDERNNVDDAIKTAEMGKESKSQGERLNVDDVIKTVDIGKDREGHDVRLDVDDVIHSTIEALKSCYAQPVDINEPMNDT
ncbi:hypothetical protein L1987_37741 [Smallanthus sonchifolius]|uniref:Uncharacterized protein n=1 Tax=Smallanthus sonchifolius TaxID=185202 RepID=A0ACB9HHX4_9ASTR|nr:hypothetical protein L1987_37741 [Smallanthus sonchifolius]